LQYVAIHSTAGSHRTIEIAAVIDPGDLLRRGLSDVTHVSPRFPLAYVRNFVKFIDRSCQFFVVAIVDLPYRCRDTGFGHTKTKTDGSVLLPSVAMMAQLLELPRAWTA